MNAEYFLLTKYIVLDPQKRRFDLSKIIDFQETIVTAILEKGISKKLTKDILSYQSCVHGLPHTHTHTHTHMHICTEAHKEKHTNIHTFIAPGIANILESVNF
jgi:hypothetical protein